MTQKVTHLLARRLASKHAFRQSLKLSDSADKHNVLNAYGFTGAAKDASAATETTNHSSFVPTNDNSAVTAMSVAVGSSEAVNEASGAILTGTLGAGTILTGSVAVGTILTGAILAGTVAAGTVGPMPAKTDVSGVYTAVAAGSSTKAA
jgi:hypothetical protein